MGKLIPIGGNEIPPVEHEGQRVITFEMIDKVHERPSGTASRNFRQNRARFIEGKHFFLMSYQESMSDEFRRSLKANPSTGLTLITEYGYLMLAKSLNDEKAWKVQEQLIDNYFRTKKGAIDFRGYCESINNALMVLGCNVREGKDRVEALAEKVDVGFEDIRSEMNNGFNNFTRLLKLGRKYFKTKDRSDYQEVCRQYLSNKCAACGDVEVVDNKGFKLPGAEFDHWNDRESDNRRKNGWLICKGCNKKFRDEGKDFRESKATEFMYFHKKMKKLEMKREHEDEQQKLFPLTEANNSGQDDPKPTGK
ncbi:MAG: ORF6N domain-containing protein [Deltaproteobacteria bacterium]|nr:ORF6N domain-containing protein [Deltaproteobacteria bacterium]